MAMSRQKMHLFEGRAMVMSRLRHDSPLYILFMAKTVPPENVGKDELSSLRFMGAHEISALKGAKKRRAGEKYESAQDRTEDLLCVRQMR